MENPQCGNSSRDLMDAVVMAEAARPSFSKYFCCGCLVRSSFWSPTPDGPKNRPAIYHQAPLDLADSVTWKEVIYCHRPRCQFHYRSSPNRPKTHHGSSEPLHASPDILQCVALVYRGLDRDTVCPQLSSLVIARSFQLS